LNFKKFWIILSTVNFFSVNLCEKNFNRHFNYDNSTDLTICVLPSGRRTRYSPETTFPSDDSLWP
jgi:hypothetical protein